ncbi:MAG: sodium-dependent transporter [Deltaproteobacteria bacterium]|nr:sodium-dependent transporter [Deltaproteobacteria bacterium]
MRESWNSRAGFVLASIGSAVGLGNIWRFAYVAGENGGGAFLLVYLLLVIAIGLPLLMAELAIGKAGAADGVSAFERLAPRSAWRRSGWLGVASAGMMLAYYSAIAGWALRYFVAAASGALSHVAAPDHAAHFWHFIGRAAEPLAWQAAMVLGAALVVAGGVARGIERLNSALMPLLALIVIALAGFALTLPGSERGVAFLFEPDWSALADPRVAAAALGQAFFSVGVGSAIFVTYGSYMRHDFSVGGSAVAVVAGDTLFAIVAGLAIFPAVFAFGIDPRSGPELAFVALPQVFASMPVGWLVAPVFFFLLSAAALTSMVSMMEVPVATAISRFCLSRARAVALIGAAVLLAGAPSAASHGLLRGVRILGRPILDASDAFVSNLMLPLSGFGVSVFCGWVLPRARALALSELGGRRLGSAWLWALRLMPALLLALIAFGLLAR